jgi:hypothetical protein
VGSISSERPAECRTKAPEWTKLTTCHSWARSADSDRWPAAAQSQRVIPKVGLRKSQSMLIPGRL